MSFPIFSDCVILPPPPACCHFRLPACWGEGASAKRDFGAIFDSVTNFFLDIFISSSRGPFALYKTSGPGQPRTIPLRAATHAAGKGPDCL